MQPEVTIVIPTRDRWELLERTALRSALRQEAVEIEVLVVDDGSVTQAPTDEAGLRDPRVRVLRHPEARGVAAARNAGIRAAAAEWIAFLDDDDLWSPWKLRAQLDRVAAVEAGFAYTGAMWVDRNLSLVRCRPPVSAASLSRELLRWNVLWGGASNVLAKTELVREVDGFDETLFQLADWDLWIRLALAAPAAAVEGLHVGLLVHPESMLLVDRRDVFDELDSLVAKHSSVATRTGVSVDRARFARWVADGHLRAGRRREAARAYVRGTKAPGNALRAAAALFGGRPFAIASRLRARREPEPRRPEWLDLYR
jgi:glycosyltransferase involved in cell wall biosynthesis